MTTTNERMSKPSLLRTFSRNVKAGLLRNRRAIFYGVTRVIVSLLFALGLFSLFMGGLFYVDGLHEMSLLFFAVSGGIYLLVTCLLCFVVSVRRAMFFE